MRKIPCWKCQKCGKYSDFTNEICACGAELKKEKIMLINPEELASEKRGKITVPEKIYFQKCSCGAVNYTDDIDKPVKICYGCGKRRIAKIKPSPYIEETQPEATEDSNAEETSSDRVTSTWKAREDGLQKIIEAEDTDQWGEDEPAWDEILGLSSEKGGLAAKPGYIVLTSLNFGSYEFRIEAKEGASCLLGRSAQHGDFLERDRRVSNRHCYLRYTEEGWMVKDNNSTNGTAVNSRDIGPGGTCLLKDGDTLKLGHNSDSMTFRIRMES